ncbi:hypothetical protein MESS2_30015 [Mesorhizobium metallidurans STM 2683]|uniref:Uncharacterized protein n=1 Tax=Mesorhizobium metallidurans STM 2683 TaxID=1297569 RepID=M5EN95_9HYPH|nr:hypothetical protein MESS2_30015 [Mesorhizobium metallidurans STM 2683]
MAFELSSMVALSMGNRRSDVDFDTLISAHVANWRERALENVPQRTLAKRLVAN